MTGGENPIIVEAEGLAKSYGKFQALKPCSFRIPAGQVVGVIGSNGAGKTTLLNALLGLHSFEGSLSVLGRNPYKHRAKLMEDVSFISDVATLPKWMRVGDVLRYVDEVHAKFDKAAALKRLAQTTNITPGMPIKNLSKGMTVQLHLSIVLAIDARLLVLDEPTLGLDVVHRRSFYDALIGEFFDHERSIIVTTHQIDEIDQILSHAIFLSRGEIVLDTPMDDIAGRFLLLEALPEKDERATALGPISKRTGIGRNTYLFEGVDRAQLVALGDVRRASLTDLFIAKMRDGEGAGGGA